MFHVSRPWTACALAVLLTGRLAAQSPEERARLDAFRAALAAVSDSTALLAQERQGIERARADRDNPLPHLELGFIAYRLGEVTGYRQHYDDAAGEFEWATELRPEWPLPWYGLGLAELALGEHPAMAVENIRQALGKDYLSKAARAFARAAEADPAFAQAVIDLAEAARRQRIGQRLEVAQRALRAATTTDAGANPALQLARGRVERDLGEGDSALAAFEAFVATGGDHALGLLEQARTLFYLRRPGEGRARYFAGAAGVLSESATTAYREDLGWIATPEELAAFDVLGAATRVAWLQSFWEGRDAREGRVVGERLAEHYRRFSYAWRHFRLTSRHRQYTTEPYRSGQSVVDDRGVIYIRHGEPDERARYVSPAVEPNESWLYERADGNWIFHFVARGDVQDFKLVESLADVFGSDQAIAWQAAGRLPPEAAALFDSRAQLDPSYRRIAASTVAQGTSLAGERRQGRLTVARGTTTDSHALRFDARLQGHVQLYAVGGADGTPRVLLVFAVPGERLAGRPHEGAMLYPLAVRVSALEDPGATVVLDTVRAFRTTAPLTAGQHLGGFAEVRLAPGVHRLRIVLSTIGGEAGDVIDVDGLEVPDFTDSVLVLSDLVLGDRAAALQWIVGGDTVALSPRGAYPEGAAAELYYELHGLPSGTRYRARIEVRGREGGSIFARIGRLFGGGPPVAFAFEGVTTDRPMRTQQTVDLAPLAPGDYVLTLTVEDPGREMRRTRTVPLRVVPR